MPLRTRLIALVALVLLLSLTGGSLLLGWHAIGSVRTELHAALDVGANTVRNAFDELAGTAEPDKELRRLVTTFNGNRHVRALLIDRQGETVAASRPRVPTEPAPAWFVRWLGREPTPIVLQLPEPLGHPGAIILEADPANEVGEVWAQSRDTMLVLGGFAAFSAVLISLVVGQALRELARVSAAFERVGEQGTHDFLPLRGPPELIRLATGFNRMTQRLAAAATQNQRLNERLLTLQAEERADLARDLHDEIGPLLFAVDMTAATIERQAGSGRIGEIPAHARSIHDAISHMQRCVRVILERLRPLGTIGLASAVDRLVAFWRVRRPEIEFVAGVRIDEGRIAADMQDTIYRVIQEGVTNAIRHGNPSRVEITIADDVHDSVRIVVMDDGRGLPKGQSFARAQVRFGLAGMRERVMAKAGSLALVPGDDGKGLRLVASFPCAAALP